MTKVLQWSIKFAVRTQIFSFTGQEFKPFSSLFYNYTCQLIFAKYPYTSACACWLLKIRLAQVQYKSLAASLRKTLTASTGTRFHRCYIFQTSLDAEGQKSASLNCFISQVLNVLLCACLMSLNIFNASAVSFFRCQAIKNPAICRGVRRSCFSKILEPSLCLALRIAFEMLAGSAFCLMCSSWNTSEDRFLV